MLGTLERVARGVWRYHYRIPEAAYLAVFVAGVVALFAAPLQGEELLLVGFTVLVGLQGVVRWQIVRRRCRASLVVPLFQQGGGAERRGPEAQTLIVDHLRRHLPEDLRQFVQAIPVTVTSAEDSFAAALQRRLRALFVLHGRIGSRPDGGWSIYPRVLEPTERSITHWDPFTRDQTPAKPSFGPIVTSLPPAVGVRDEEFPLDFCRDLEAVIQGIAGMAAEAFELHDEAERLLDEALTRAGDSANHQIDALRVARARAIANQDRLNEGIDALRNRARRPDPSPHLLRGLAYLLGRRAWADPSRAAADHDEAAEWLRHALEDEADPQRDMTTYNLLNQLPAPDDEYQPLLEQLLRPQSTYRRLWYVKRLEANQHWRRVEAAQAAGDFEAAAAAGREAARWYGRTLRARPRLLLLAITLRPPFVLYRTINRSPILYANTFDAHAVAGHRLRAIYFEWRFQRIRRSHLKRAERHLRTGEWNPAYAHFDWASFVGRHDVIEHRALAFTACCCWKGSRTEDGLRMWEEAAEHDPECLIGRAMMVAVLEEEGLDPSVPGDEPAGMEETMSYIEQRFPGWTAT